MRTALYRLFDETGSLLYVGITKDLHLRWDYHAEDKFWWHLVTRIEVVWHKSREAADSAEREAIRDKGPIYNRTLNKEKIPLPEGARLPDPFLDSCAESLREGIASGRYPDGFVFTACLDTALSLNVSPITLARAMCQLVKEGLVYQGPDVRVRQKRGRTFVVGERPPVPLPDPPPASPAGFRRVADRGFGAFDLE